MFVGEVYRYICLFPLSIFIVLLVCPARGVEVGVVSVGGFMVWATCWLCCVFFVLCGFVLDRGLLVMFHPHCIVYYRVPGLHCAWGPTDTWLVCLSTVSFLL